MQQRARAHGIAGVIRQRRQFRICKLQKLKGPVGFESHPLRHQFQPNPLGKTHSSRKVSAAVTVFLDTPLVVQSHRLNRRFHRIRTCNRLLSLPAAGNTAEFLMPTSYKPSGHRSRLRTNISVPAQARTVESSANRGRLKPRTCQVLDQRSRQPGRSSAGRKLMDEPLGWTFYTLIV